MSVKGYLVPEEIPILTMELANGEPIPSSVFRKPTNNQINSTKWVPNEIFVETLELEVVALGTRFDIRFWSNKFDAWLNIFPGCFTELLEKAKIREGKVAGRWQFVQKANHYSIRYLGSTEIEGDLSVENERLKEALKVYADPDNWSKFPQSQFGYRWYRNIFVKKEGETGPEAAQLALGDY